MHLLEGARPADWAGAAGGEDAELRAFRAFYRWQRSIAGRLADRAGGYWGHCNCMRGGAGVEEGAGLRAFRAFYRWQRSMAGR